MTAHGVEATATAGHRRGRVGAPRRRAPGAVVVAAVALVLAACGGTVTSRSAASRRAAAATTTTVPTPTTAAPPAGALPPAPPQGGPGPETVPVPDVPALAGLSTAATGQPVDGITCDTSEQSVYHIHVHLTVFVDGGQRQVPAGVGIPDVQLQQTPAGLFAGGGTCLYWLHTHAGDGIVHVESPKQATFTLGDFFDIWGQPLSSTQVGPATGPVTVFVDGQPYSGDPRAIGLTEHREIQLEVGTPLVAPVTVASWGGL